MASEQPSAGPGYKPRPRVEAKGGSCGCCGTDSGQPNVTIYRAGLVDQDGDYYPFLCGGCFDLIENELREYAKRSFKQQVADSLVELMPNEIADGVVSELEDAESMGLFDGE